MGLFLLLRLPRSLFALVAARIKRDKNNKKTKKKLHSPRFELTHKININGKFKLALSRRWTMVERYNTLTHADAQQTKTHSFQSASHESRHTTSPSAPPRCSLLSNLLVVYDRCRYRDNDAIFWRLDDWRHLVVHLITNFCLLQLLLAFVYNHKYHCN